MSANGSDPGIRQETGPEPILRRVNGRFAPGVSPNPTGRPKGTRNFANTIQVQTKDGEELVRFMLRVFRGNLAGTKVRLEDRMAAATWLADRGFGKPSQVQLLTGDGGGLISLTEAKQAADDFRRRIVDLVARNETSPRDDVPDRWDERGLPASGKADERDESLLLTQRLGRL
jgi:hypothetical protein